MSHDLHGLRRLTWAMTFQRCIVLFPLMAFINFLTKTCVVCTVQNWTKNHNYEGFTGVQSYMYHASLSHKKIPPHDILHNYNALWFNSLLNFISVVSIRHNQAPRTLLGFNLIKSTAKKKLPFLAD